MQRFFIFLVFCASLCVLRKSVTLGPKLMNEEKIRERFNYVKGLTPKFVTSLDTSSRYVASVKIPAPDPTKIFYLAVKLHSRLADGTLLDPPALDAVNEGGVLSLNVPFERSQLTKQYGCDNFTQDRNFSRTQCRFTVNYVATEKDELLLSTNYTMNVKIPVNGDMSLIALNGARIYKNGCDCEIFPTNEVSITIYTDPDCTIPFPGKNITVGSALCFKMQTTNELAVKYFLETTSVTMLYNTKEGPKEIELMNYVKHTSNKGSTTAYFELTIVGNNIMFTHTAILKSEIAGIIALADPVVNKGLRASPINISVTPPPLPPVEVCDASTSSGKVIVPSLILLMLTLLFL